MNLRQMRYFLTIAKEGGITPAARALHMAQPPLSKQLRLLEDELGVQLAERGSRAVRLTEAGRILQGRAEQILALADAAAREVQNAGAGMRGRLVLGAVSSSGLPDGTTEAFYQQYPHVSFEIHEGNTYQILDFLQSGRVEVGIVRTPFNRTGLLCRFGSPEPMMAVYAGEDPFPGRDEIRFEELQGHRLIIYRRFERLLREVSGEAGVALDIACTSDDARTAANWAKAGFGLGIAPRSAVTRASGLAGKRIAHPRLRTQLAVVCLKDRPLSAVARRYFESCPQYGRQAN